MIRNKGGEKCMNKQLANKILKLNTIFYSKLCTFKLCHEVTDEIVCVHCLNAAENE